MPADLVDALRAGDHDVEWVREFAPGIDDATVLARAREEARVVFTFDKDFGELAFRVGLPADCGVILVRISGLRPAELVARVVAAVATLPSATGVFVVVESNRVRVTPLPARTHH